MYYRIRRLSTLNLEVVNLELERQKRDTAIILELLLIAMCAYLVLNTIHLVLADNLLDLFDSYAFRGSLKTIDKFNWVGKLMSYIISVFSMIGLFLVCYQRLISLLYLAGRNTFDTVHEIKSSLSSGSGRDAFGIRSMFTNAMQGGGQYGTGLDAIVGFLLSLLPDVKKYSDYNPERMAFNVQEDDSCTTYMLKTAIPTIMMIFFFAMGYNGTLWQGYGVIVDAMGTAADQLVSTDLNSIVSTAMNTGKAYKFSWDASGSDYGDFMQDMVKAVYKQALKNGRDYTSDTQQSVGSYVDSIFLTGKGYNKSDMKLYKGSTNKTISIGKGKGSIFTDADTLAKAIGNTTGFKGEDDAKNLTYTVISNSTKDSYKISNAVELVISAYDVGLNSSANGNYIHVTISRKKNSDETMYWHKADDGAKPTKNGTSSGKSNSSTSKKNSGKQ